MYTLIPYRTHRTVSNSSLDAMDDQFMRSFLSMTDMMTSGMGFKVDIKESKEAFTLEAEMPGVQQDQIDLSIDDNVLTISCETKHEEKQEDTRYTYSERRYGHMSRSFNLDGIDQGGIKADYKDGILYVTLPKEQPVQKNMPRKILIGSSAKEEEAKE